MNIDLPNCKLFLLSVGDSVRDGAGSEGDCGGGQVDPGERVHPGRDLPALQHRRGAGGLQDQPQRAAREYRKISV